MRVFHSFPFFFFKKEVGFSRPEHRVHMLGNSEQKESKKQHREEGACIKVYVWNPHRRQCIEHVRRFCVEGRVGAGCMRDESGEEIVKKCSAWVMA